MNSRFSLTISLIKFAQRINIHLCILTHFKHILKYTTSNSYENLLTYCAGILHTKGVFYMKHNTRKLGVSGLLVAIATGKKDKPKQNTICNVFLVLAYLSMLSISFLISGLQLF